MGSLTCAEMRQLEGEAFQRGATPEDLMEKAGRGIAAAITRRYPSPGHAVACIGSGNNGGDALVAIRHLSEKGWSIGIQCLHAVTKLGALPRKKWRELGDCPVNAPLEEVDPRFSLVLLDGLLGVGAKGAFRPPLNELALWMNDTRTSRLADTIAMDIPSGLNGDTGEVCEGAIIADLTLTVGVPKLGLFSSSAANQTGAIECVPLVELPQPENGRPCLNDRHSLRGLLPRRPHDYHKGNAGRVGILAGSQGMLGAAVLCAKGALHGGSGLVTLFTKEALYPILAPMLPPEVMLKPIKSLSEINEVPLDVLAIGPGMGSCSNTEWSNDEFLELLKQTSINMVLDADGLNRIAADGPGEYIKSNMILTPHPGEMAGLFPDLSNSSRFQTAEAFTKQFPETTLLLKGARSLIARSGSPIYINGTGHPSMACGGQGDVLTGVIAALLGQGVSQFDAARLGAWLCGRAAEFALSHGNASAQSMIASDVTDWLGSAFGEIV